MDPYIRPFVRLTDLLLKKECDRQYPFIVKKSLRKRVESRVYRWKGVPWEVREWNDKTWVSYTVIEVIKNQCANGNRRRDSDRWGPIKGSRQGKWWNMSRRSFTGFRTVPDVYWHHVFVLVMQELSPVSIRCWNDVLKFQIAQNWPLSYLARMVRLLVWHFTHSGYSDCTRTTLTTQITVTFVNRRISWREQ